MIPVITYSLRGTDANSDAYYRAVAEFADQVIVEGESRCGTRMTGLQAFAQRTNRETPRTRAEYTYDLLALGVLWRCHAGAAQKLAALPGDVLTRLAELRERDPRFKPAADWLRGILGTFFLQSNQGETHRDPEVTLAGLDRLLLWLAATGNFNEEVERLTLAREWFGEQAPGTAGAHMQAVLDFGSWFETTSREMLGRYTPNVDAFLSNVHPHYRWRADAVFCGRQRVEYHLNMVGTEILNRAFRDSFVQAARKVVLVPPCMRYQPEEKCKAHSTESGAQCGHCTPQCRVHQLTKLGEKYGFPVFMLPDELRVFSTGSVKARSDLGIVGVSCALTNAPGGWETKRLGVPAQGVLLDYCGCKWHWDKKGVPTDINMNQLLRVLGLNR